MDYLDGDIDSERLDVSGKPSHPSIELPGLFDAGHVERVQEQTLEAIEQHHGAQESSGRSNRLILLLGVLRSARTSVLEDVYFRSTIGPVPIERILCDVLQSAT